MTTTTQRGFSLVETLLTLGAISVMSLAIYAVLAPASATAQAKQEQDNLRDLSTAVDRSFGLLGSFSSVSTAQVLADDLAPARMRQGNDLQTAWGTRVGVHPHAVRAPGDAFLVVYPLAPAEVCARLAAAMARAAFDIRVEGRTVYADGFLDPTITVEQCGQYDAASMEFVFHSGLVSGAAVAASPLVLPPAPPSASRPPSAPTTVAVPGAPGVGPAQPGAPVVVPPSTPAPPPPAAPAPSPAPSVVPFPGSTPPPSPPVSPPGAMCSAPAPVSVPDSRPQSCPSGQLGAITQERTGTRAYSCPEAWDSPVLGPVVWGVWTTTGNTCAPACAAPAPTSVAISRAAPTQTQNTCPAGYTGSTPQIRTGTEAGTRTTSWMCPAPTGSPTSTSADTWSGAYAYGGWTANGPDTCAAPPPVCSAPSPTSTAISRAAPNENQDVGCPSGQVGNHFQTRPRTEMGTRTTSWTCPGPTSSSWDTWSGTYTYGTWTTTSNTCKAEGPPTGTVLWECSQGGDAFYFMCRIDYQMAITFKPGEASISHWTDQGEYSEDATLTVPISACASGKAHAFSYVSYGKAQCL